MALAYQQRVTEQIKVVMSVLHYNFLDAERTSRTRDMFEEACRILCSYIPGIDSQFFLPNPSRHPHLHLSSSPQISKTMMTIKVYGALCELLFSASTHP